MSPYYRRIITYDEHTQNYKVEVPALGLEILGDTESNALQHMREEIEDYVKRQSKLIKENNAKDLDNNFSEYQD